MTENFDDHPDAVDVRWWHDAVGYEVYIRSFADGDGDGIGDLHGLVERLDHIADLGATLVWVTPIYPSPMADFGYDVADYCGVNPIYGDLDVFDRLVAEAHDRGLKVVVDIVPNHTSDQHPWFVDARSGPDSDYRDYYIWRDPAPDGGPPNNWVSYFGGPAWTFDPASNQYYLHLFLPEQPDLDWANPAVADAFDDVLRFWLDRGIDGFRIDVAQAMGKDGQLRSNPQIGPWDDTAPRWQQWDAFDHRHDILQPSTLDIFRRWNKVVEPYDALLLGETYVFDAGDLARLLPGEGLHVGFWFELMHVGWSAQDVRNAIAAPLERVADRRSIGWALASHDEQRPPTRFAPAADDTQTGEGSRDGADLGRRRALALTTLLFGLPGLPVLYQGEELGLVDGEVSDERRADPVGADVTLSRDGCRTPMPWDRGPGHGFSTATDTWLPMGGRTDDDSAAAQRDDPTSSFSAYRALVKARRETPELLEPDLSWLDRDGETWPHVVAYERGSVVVAANIGSEPIELTGIDGTIVFSTAGRSGEFVDPTLEPADAVIVRR